MRRLSNELVLVLAMVLAAVAWTSQQWSAFAAHAPQWGHDLAFFNQIFWSAAHGGQWASPLLLEPQGFFEMVHFHPVFALLVPLYWLWPDPRTLQLFNVLAVVGAAWPLSRLGKAASGHAGFGLCAGLAWLAWVPVQSAALADFRPMIFFVPGFVVLLWGAWTGRWVPLVLGALLICITREESGYLLVFCGLVLSARPMGQGTRRQGAVVLGVGVCWFLLLLAIKGNLFFHFDPRTYTAGATASVPEELVGARLGYGLRVLLSGYGLALLSPISLVLAGPPTAFLVLDSFREWHSVTGPYVHLRSASLALIACGGTLGAAWLCRRDARLPWLVGALLVVANLGAFWGDRQRLRAIHAGHVEVLSSSQWQAREALLQQVAPEDAVGTDYTLIARLSGRELLWNTIHLYMKGEQARHWTEPWPITADDLDVLVVTPEDPVLQHLGPEWERTDAGGGYELWQQRKPSSP